MLSGRTLTRSLLWDASSGFSTITSRLLGHRAPEWLPCDALSGSPRLADASQHIGVEIPPPRGATQTCRCLTASSANSAKKETNCTDWTSSRHLGALLSLIVQGVSQVLRENAAKLTSWEGREGPRGLELLLHFLLAGKWRHYSWSLLTPP